MQTPDRASAARGVSCEDARRLLSAFVDGGLSAPGRQLLVRHVGSCEPCRTAYRANLETAGKLGANVRAAREERVTEEREGLRERHRRLAIEAASKSKRGVHRGAFLRLALLPAAIVFLITQIAGIQQPPRPFDVSWKSGSVNVADSDLSRYHTEAQMIGGQWCWTGADGAARIEGGGVEVALDSDTQLLLEDQRGPRLLLRRGSLTVDGSCEVTTPLGVVSVESGSGEVAYRDRELVVRSLGGKLAVHNAEVRHRLGPGDPPLALK